MTDITRHHPTIRISQAVGCRGLLFTAGQVADNAEGLDAEAQTAAILRKIDALLAEAGTGKRAILSASVYLADMADFDAMNRAWDAWVAQGDKPARTTVEARLTEPAFKVEIGVVATLASQGAAA